MDQPTIIIHGAEWCPPCHMAKKYLTDKGLTYTYKDIDTDPALALEVVDKSGQRGIPVIDIDGKIIVGFDRPAIDAALAAHPAS